MGVHGLWNLLAPVGRRVSVETLSGKRLAIDASIWMVQFMKAMRDEKGEMVRNAHLLGFFRRICKLLYLKTKPVFVFDGGTPALKRRTVIARRRQRENAQAKIRKTAEKLLLNHLKTMRLKELAKDLENQRKNQKNDSKGKKILSDQMSVMGNNSERNDVVSVSGDKENVDAMLAASIAEEENEGSRKNASTSDSAIPSEDKDGDEEMILPKNDVKGKKILSDDPDQANVAGINAERNHTASKSYDHKKLDEMLAASIAAEEDGSLLNEASTSAALVFSEEEDGDEDEEMILPTMDGNVDPAVLASLPPSMRHDLLVQKNDAKGKKVLSDDPDQANVAGSNAERNHMASKSYDHKKLDEMLAASIAAEEDESLLKEASTSAALVFSEEEDGDEDEEMILPAMDGNVDPAVLASLPPSMQLDLLVQMRERLMAENRQKYQKVKKAPEKFSEVQIQAYLKTVAFRREINEVQKAAAGRGVGGVQTSRIASEANREFIFSSSFTGDKQVLASARVQRDGDKQQQTPSNRSSEVSMNNAVASISKSNDVSGLTPDDSSRILDGDVETYLDERGRVRVSRVRAMGVRMTRDLRRNLDMMKEIENDRTNTNKIMDADSMLYLNKSGASKGFSRKNKFVETSHDDNSEPMNLNEMHKRSMLKNEHSIEISFEDISENKCADEDDDLFARLAAAGNPTSIVTAENTFSGRQSSGVISDSDWEEGIIEGKDNSFSNDANEEIKPPLNIKEGGMGDESDMEWDEGIIEGKGNSLSNDVNEELKAPPNLNEGDLSDESDVEWEEGPSVAPKSSFSCPSESGKTVSKGYLEEETNLQEALRRSLLDRCGDKSNYVLSESDKSKNSGENAYDGMEFLGEENNMCGENVTQQNELFCETVSVAKKQDIVGSVNNSLVIDSLQNQLKLSVAHNPDSKEIRVNKSCERYPGSHSEQSSQDANERSYTYRDVPCAESVATPEPKEVQFGKGQCMDASNEGGERSNLVEKCSKDNPNSCDVVLGFMDSIQVRDKENDSEAKFSILVDDKQNELEAEPSAIVKNKKSDFDAEALRHKIGISDSSVSKVESSRNESMYNIDFERNLASERSHHSHFNGMEHNVKKSAIKENKNVQAEFTEASLEEEIVNLDQEYMNLGDEQRKLERNAESVSSEMFAECQELLQMFGLPYIIAPMEAEAQCAYMELENLVDGVVTDDSDVFLFGARSVYKNIFDDRKYVETYFMQDIEKELGMTREKLIRIALLLGSDYTEGVSGIGIVNAIEVINAFPEEDGLHEFRQWIESPDPTILGKFDVQTGSKARKKGSKVGGHDGNQAKSSVERISEFGQNMSQADESKQSADGDQEIKEIFMDNHRNVSKNWHIPASFPSEAVISAYSCPQVDKSTEPFSWGKPDLFVLRKFCWDKFAWGGEKSDELLLPVLKEYNKRETQLRLEAFYTFNEKFAKVRSKRIKKAVKGITGKQSSKSTDAAAQEVPKSRKKRKVRCLESGSNKLDNVSKETEESVAGTQNNKMEKPTPKHSRKRRVPEKLVSSEKENPEPPMQTDGGKNKVSRGNGRGRGRRVGRGRLGAEPSETISSDGIGGNSEPEVCAEKIEVSQQVRRSTRSRKPVNYSVGDPEVDDLGKILSNKETSDEEAVGQDLYTVHGICGEASAGHIRKKQHEAGDPLVEEGFSVDYRESGGGFCNESDIDQPSVSQSEDPILETEISKDYLVTGGGFCVNESEDETAAQPPIIGENVESPCFDFVEKVGDSIGSGDFISGHGISLDGLQNELDPGLQNATSKDDYSKVGVPLQENIEGDAEKASAGALTAMPFLKRKRKKN